MKHPGCVAKWWLSNNINYAKKHKRIMIDYTHPTILAGYSSHLLKVRHKKRHVSKLILPIGKNKTTKKRATRKQTPEAHTEGSTFQTSRAHRKDKNKLRNSTDPKKQAAVMGKHSGKEGKLPRQKRKNSETARYSWKPWAPSWGICTGRYPRKTQSHQGRPNKEADRRRKRTHKEEANEEDEKDHCRRGQLCKRINTRRQR